MRVTRRSLQLIVLFLAGGYLAFQAVRVAYQDRQHDFRTYYYAASTWLSGGDPYDPVVVGLQSDREAVHPFVYPPFSLPLLAPFAQLPYRAAHILFLVLKCAALVLLVGVWRRTFPKETAEVVPLVLLTAVGFRETVVKDIVAGNISVFEQLMLWTGIYLAIARRYATSGLYVAGSALLKSVTVWFAALPVLAERSRRAWVGVAWALVPLGVLHLSSFRTSRSAYRSFSSAALLLDERGGINPSALAILRDVAERAGLTDPVAAAAYVLLVVLILTVTLRAIHQLREVHRPELLVALWALAFVLIVPRMKDYSYVVVIMPALIVIHHALSDVRLKWMALGATCIGFFGYQPYFASAALFVLLLRHIRHSVHVSAPAIGSTPEDG